MAVAILSNGICETELLGNLNKLRLKLYLNRYFQALLIFIGKELLIEISKLIMFS